MSNSNRLRKCIFRPYLKGLGPVYRLKTWDTNRCDHMRKSIIGYELRQDQTLLFTGEDFACSPMHAIDSDECVAALMNFLTLRPGDTDSEYFENYNAKQLEFCSNHAEALSCEVSYRFGEI